MWTGSYFPKNQAQPTASLAVERDSATTVVVWGSYDCVLPRLHALWTPLSRDASGDVVHRQWRTLYVRRRTHPQGRWC